MTIRQLVTAILLYAIAGNFAQAKLIALEEAIEGIATINYSAHRGEGTLSIRTCDQCKSKKFQLTPRTPVYNRGVRVKINALLERDKKFVTVIYDIKTGKLKRIIW
jgi:hypothetical protein